MASETEDVSSYDNGATGTGENEQPTCNSVSDDNNNNDSGGKSLNFVQLIAKKRDGQTLDDFEIEFIVDAVSRKTIDHVQIGALLMAIRLNGMNDAEIVQLTRRMTTSGHVFRWPDAWRHLVVDKHSTGGVGDKTSLVLAPALAACGLKVPMVSGRGLGHTGGTLDKLESIPGFTVAQSADDIRACVDDPGCCIVGQTAALVPADGVLYAARDVTATVDSVPLITASIVSKKAAEGLSALVMDVKVGKAAVLADEASARRLAQSLVTVSKEQGMKTTALLTKMDSPVGNTVGHALEVAEAVDCLHGNGPRPLVDLVTRLGGHLLSDVGQASSSAEGAEMLEATLHDGRALEKFRAMLVSQGVDSDTAHALCERGADVFRVLPAANFTTDVVALSTGNVLEIDAMVCADVCGELGGSRFKASDTIDMAVGIVIRRHVGSHVNTGDVVLVVHHNRPLANELLTKLENAITIETQPLDKNSALDLVLEVIK